MILFPLPDEFMAVLAILTAIFGVARLTRVIVYDDFPPSVWWRMTWSRITNDGPWAKLFMCWWCLSSWIALVCILWYAFLTPLHPVWLYGWWVFWGMLALGYAATMVIVRDEPKSE